MEAQLFSSVVIMKFIRQHLSLDVDNHSVESNSISKHSQLLPDSIKCIICGPSNCGKTNLMLTLLYHQNGLKYENIYLFSKTLRQSKYVQLQRIIDKVDGVELYTFESNEDIPPPELAKKNSIFIFDDIACAKQNVARSYFCQGRHNGVDSFYLCQSYTRVPKHLIRDNTNFLILFKQDGLNIRRIYEDHVNPDMTHKQFIKILNICWKPKYGFLVIDKTSETCSGRYRKGFNVYIKP